MNPLSRSASHNQRAQSQAPLGISVNHTADRLTTSVASFIDLMWHMFDDYAKLCFRDLNHVNSEIMKLRIKYRIILGTHSDYYNFNEVHRRGESGNQHSVRHGNRMAIKL